MTDQEAYKILKDDIMADIAKLSFVKESDLSTLETKIMDKMKEWDFLRGKLDPASDGKEKAAQLSADWLKALAFGDHGAIVNMEKDSPNLFTKQVLASGATQLVPSQFIARLIELVAEEAPYRRYATVIPVTSSGGSVPKEGTGIVAYRTAEGYSPAVSDPTFGQVTFSTYELCAKSYWSEKLFEISGIPLTDFIARITARAFATKEWAEMITGTGTLQFKGLNAETLDEIDAAGGLDWDFFVKMYFSIKGSDRARAVVIANDLALTSLFSAKDAMGRPFFDVTTERLMNKPILSNESVANNIGYYGNLGAYYIFDQRNYQLRVSREGDELITKRLVLFFASCDNDGELTRTAAFRKITNIA